MSENVRSHTEVALEAGPRADHLGRHVLLVADVFVVHVTPFILQHNNNNQRQSILSNVAIQKQSKVFGILLFGKLKPFRLFNLDVDFLAALLHLVEKFVSILEVLVSVIGNDPSLVLQVHCFLDGKLSQKVLIYLSQCPFQNNRRSWKDIGVHLLRVIGQFHSPSLKSLLFT